jgi:hypothetical protein
MKGKKISSSVIIASLVKYEGVIVLAAEEIGMSPAALHKRVRTDIHLKEVFNEQEENRVQDLKDQLYIRAAKNHELRALEKYLEYFAVEKQPDQVVQTIGTNNNFVINRVIMTKANKRNEA